MPELEIEEIKPGELPKTPSSSSSMEPLEAKAVVVDIVSDTLEYDTEKDLYTATGAVHVIVSEQNTELVADKVVYDQNQELMIAEGNVIITNRGEKTFGTYAKIDLTRKSALINDPIARLKELRVKAKQGFVADGYVELENGKLVLPAKKPLAKPAYHYDSLDEGDLSQLAVANPLLKHKDKYPGSVVEEHLDMGWDESKGGFRSKFRLHAKEVEIKQGEDGYNDINLVSPSLSFGGFKLARMNQMDFSHDEGTGDIEYLGPDIGIDPDFGGFYFGPGWDFRLGKGIVKVSPLASFGVGARRKRGGQDIEDTSGFGLGGVLNYMSNTTRLRMGYNHKIGTPVIYGRKQLFDGKTHLMVGANEDYNQGYLGWERPQYIAQITDSRKVMEKKNVRIDTFSSLGVAHDEFFPTNDEDFFVKPEDPEAEPVTAGRLQLQAEIRNIKPLLQFGGDRRYMQVGVSGQMAMAGYTTGDMVGVFRAGPNMYFRLGDRFTSYNRYFYAETAGETPFVFDTYYRGRNSVLSVNQFRVNKYLTLGLRSNMSLNQDNARGSLFTGNSFFALIGPDDVKLNIAYDFIRKRSFFGISYLPGNDKKVLNYDRLKYYQPVDYGQGPNAMPGPNPMMDIQDVGMMNGSKAQ